MTDESMDDWANAGLDGGNLSQDQIDNLLGVQAGGGQSADESSGIELMLNRAMMSYERLPLLEIVFDRFVRMISGSLRIFTSHNVDVDITSIASTRFEDYINSVPMPALLVIFKAMEWENYGVITFDSSLIYSMIEILFGGKKAAKAIKIEGRPYTTIEQNVARKMSEIILNDLGGAFDAISPATLEFERMETNPRFATIARPGDAAIVVKLRFDMDEYSGQVEVLFPYATLEPIKKLLSQVFMGEKLGVDSAWINHIGTKFLNAHIDVQANLGKLSKPFDEVLAWKKGTTLLLDKTPDDDIIVLCKGIALATGRMGRVKDKVSVSVRDFISQSMREQLE